MVFENLIYEVRDAIAFITFNRPKVLNALNRKTIEELRDALVAARDDATVRVLILTGAGEKSFVAGADIGELALQTPVKGKEFSLFGQSVFQLLETIGKPSICAINGFLFDSNRKQNRKTRPARGKTRDYSWIWRLATPGAALR
jgi:enoyl-CoA hydratase